MSSDSIESVYKALLLNNYISLIGCTIIGYDYVLMFSREVDYIWRRRWTWVSGIFILVRYPGLCWGMLGGLIGTSFIPGPLKTYAPQLLHFMYVSMLTPCPQGGNERKLSTGSVLFLVSCWTFPVFIYAADLVMILRVYTMWNRSRPILFVLLFFYVVQVIVSVVVAAIYNSSDVYFITTTVQVLNFTICSGTFTGVPILLGIYGEIPRFLVSVALLVLAVAQTLRQLVGMYNATKQWQPNQYMNLFLRDGIFYFFMITSYNVIVTVTATPTISTPPIVANVIGTLCTSLLCCSMPRFIISVRELYDRDLRGRWQGIDTGFGAVSRGVSAEKRKTSAIAFADVGQESRTLEGSGDVLGEIQLEPTGGRLHLV